MSTSACMTATAGEIVVFRLGLVNLLWYPFSPRPDLEAQAFARSEVVIDDLVECSKALRTADEFRGSVIDCKRLPSGEIQLHVAAESFMAIVFGLSYVSQKLDDWEFSTLMDVSRSKVEDLIVRLLTSVKWES